MKTLGITKTVQKHINQQQIIRMISRNDMCNRVGLAQSMDLTTAAMTKLVTPLIAQGLVTEEKAKTGCAGRKPMILSLNPDKCTFLSVRIERRRFSVAAYNFAGQQIKFVNNLFGKTLTPHQVMDSIIETLLEMKASCPNTIAVGIAVPGPFSTEKERVMLMSGFPGWEDIEIRSRIEEATGLYSFIEQDANCGAFAELWFEKDEIDNLIFVVAERGIGAGVVIDGKILRGNCGYAGEFGHMSINPDGPVCECGNHGCLEMYASYNVLESRYLNASGLKSIAIEEMINRIKNGDEVAVEIYKDVVRKLAYGVVNLANVFDPQLIVFNHILTRPEKIFIDTVDEVFKERLMPELYQKLKLRICSISGDPVINGAALMTFDKMIEEHFDLFIE